MRRIANDATSGGTENVGESTPMRTEVAVGGFSQELGLVFLGDVLLNMDVADVSLVLLNLACEFHRKA